MNSGFFSSSMHFLRANGSHRSHFMVCVRAEWCINFNKAATAARPAARPAAQNHFLYSILTKWYRVSSARNLLLNWTRATYLALNIPHEARCSINGDQWFIECTRWQQSTHTHARFTQSAAEWAIYTKWLQWFVVVIENSRNGQR